MMKKLQYSFTLKFILERLDNGDYENPVTHLYEGEGLSVELGGERNENGLDLFEYSRILLENVLSQFAFCGLADYDRDEILKNLLKYFIKEINEWHLRGNGICKIDDELAEEIVLRNKWEFGIEDLKMKVVHEGAYWNAIAKKVVFVEPKHNFVNIDFPWV